ncbi:MAG: helix-turn-helix domain-containing protein [Acetobacter sp.]|uniref:helix-turn-helix domain-containing protein n=1 Tax=Acetobacter sp. TaxID=440 RepID=UPI0039E8EFE1
MSVPGGDPREALASSSSEVVRSWQRCQATYNLDPAQTWAADVLSSMEFRYINERSAFLLSVAIPEMQRLYAMVRDLGLMVLLSDPQAVILARCIGENHKAVCRRLRLQEGAIWDEGAAGTNGVGTVLKDGCPITLTRGDHWRFCFSLLESHAAPIFGEHGQTLGVLNLATFSTTTTRPLAPVLMETLCQAARRIEEQILRNACPGQRIVALGLAGGPSAPLVAMNDGGMVTGATRAARTLMGWPEKMDGTGPATVMKLSDGPMTFRMAEEQVVRTALSLARGNVTNAARRLGISRATFYRKLKTFQTGGGQDC